MRGQTIAQACAAALLSLVLVGCGSGGGGISLIPGGSSSSSSGGSSSSSSSSGSSSGGSSGGSSSGSVTSACASLKLLTSSAQLPSAASTQANGVTITALCKDSNNNAVSGMLVTFSASAGLIQVTQSTTDTSGKAIAILTTGGDPTNQTITISATSGTTSATQLPVVEEGTNLRISGPLVVGSSQTGSYVVTLVDSSGNAIPNSTVSLASSLKNPVAPASAATAANGQATFTYTGTTAGSDTLSASSASLQASTSYAMSVSATSLTFSQPANTSTAIPFNTPQQVSVTYISNGTAVSGAAINFSASRGTFTSTASCSASATGSISANTNTSGVATVYLCATGAQGAGGTIVTAAVSGSGPTSTIALQFQATTPATISIEATPSTIAPSGSSVVKAVVYDASDNLVQGQLVNFVLNDPTGGSLSSASGVTDQSGSVSVTYQATSVSSAQGGVQVTASVNGTSVKTPKPAAITVGGQSLRITLGTGNTISTLDQTRYQMPYSVLVTDSAGNPVPNATFNLSIMSVAYQKGQWVTCSSTLGKSLFAVCSSSSPPAWVQDQTVSSSDAHYNTYPAGQPPPYNVLYQLPFGCLTEDPQNTGIYSTSLDYNNNGVLDPGAVASVPSSVTLDSTGSAQFFITYPKDHAAWVEVLLTGIASVSGTETTATAVFSLPILASDISNPAINPPGAISPYGTVGSCASSQ